MRANWQRFLGMIDDNPRYEKYNTIYFLILSFYLYFSIILVPTCLKMQSFKKSILDVLADLKITPYFPSVS